MPSALRSAVYMGLCRSPPAPPAVLRLYMRLLDPAAGFTTVLQPPFTAPPATCLPRFLSAAPPFWFHRSFLSPLNFLLTAPAAFRSACCLRFCVLRSAFSWFCRLHLSSCVPPAVLPVLLHCHRFYRSSGFWIHHLPAATAVLPPWFFYLCRLPFLLPCRRLPF